MEILWRKLTSENKPNDRQWVLVTGTSGLSDRNSVFYARYEEFRNRFFTGTEFDEAESFYTTRVYDVTHWMSIPAPYRGEKEFSDPIKCPACDGRGKVFLSYQPEATCKRCSGTGFIKTVGDPKEPMQEEIDAINNLPHDEKVEMLRETVQGLKGTASDLWRKNTEKAIDELEEGNWQSALKLLMCTMMDMSGEQEENRPG